MKDKQNKDFILIMIAVLAVIALIYLLALIGNKKRRSAVITMQPPISQQESATPAPEMAASPVSMIEVEPAPRFEEDLTVDNTFSAPVVDANGTTFIEDELPTPVVTPAPIVDIVTNDAI